MESDENKNKANDKSKERDAYSEIEKDPIEGNAHEQDLLEQASNAATAAYIIDNGVEGEEPHQSKPDATKDEKASVCNTKQ